ncbi:MAG: DUF1730 domain-containing protein [Kiritimatiellaceae bacterium]|nr:DUF1730 domain-containing protein [Kiritimatiellaceae bacterium]
MAMIRENFQEWLRLVAQEIGAESIASIRLDNPELKRQIEQNNQQADAWLAAGFHGEMDYLERMQADKSNPWGAFPFAKSVLVVCFTNGWGDPHATHPFPPPAPDALLGYISAYAKETDYHRVGYSMLSTLSERLGPDIRSEASVDTKAVYERLFATVGGLGVIGSNTLLRIPTRTNVRVFIGSLFVDEKLPEVIHRANMPYSCQDCNQCLHGCPTGAIQLNKPMDARKCISYLTIEKRSLLTHDEAQLTENWLFGCDWCTITCPPRDTLDTRIPVDLEWLLKTPAGQLRKLLKDSACSYAGITQLRKNAVIILKKMNTDRSRNLLEWVRNHTGSDLIRQQLDLW